MKKHIVIGLMVAALSLTGCASKPVPDDQRELNPPAQALDAANAPEVKTPIKPEPSMGAGTVNNAPIETTDEPVDNGTMIMLPTTEETTVAKNEKVILYAGQLKPDTEYSAKLFYSENGKDDKTIELGKYKVNADGEVKAGIVVPSNLVSGKYVISLDAGEGLFLAPIKVG